MAVFKAPCRTQSGVCDHPIQKPPTIQIGFLGYNLNPSPHLARGKGGRQVWVTEKIGVLETALTNQPLRIDHKPPACFAIEYIVMVEVTMENH